MSHKATSHKAAKPRYQSAAVTLSYHERMLLTVYRALKDEQRQAIDRAVSYEWSGRRQETGYVPSAQEVTDENAAFGTAAKALCQKGDPHDGLAYFANCWKPASASGRRPVARAKGVA